jgi:hypothetical protein
VLSLLRKERNKKRTKRIKERKEEQKNAVLTNTILKILTLTTHFP